MKICSACGCRNEDDARFCTNCGARYPDPVSDPVPEAGSVAEVVSAEAPAVPSAEAIAPPRSAPSDSRSAEGRKQDRIAVAGFVLSFLGLASVFAFPLQFFALFLSAFSRPEKARRWRSLGIVLSIVSLVISLIVWGILFAFSDRILPVLHDLMNMNMY